MGKWWPGIWRSRRSLVVPPVQTHRAAAPRWNGACGPFARLELVPGWQPIPGENLIFLVGTGAQSYLAHGLLRGGVQRLALCDPDVFSVSNLSRQLAFPEDVGRAKVHQLAKTLCRDALAGAEITSIALPFPRACSFLPGPPALVSCLVDSNPCRVAVARWARALGIPAVFGGLSNDGLRWYAMLQLPGGDQPCLACAHPDLPPIPAPCAAGCLKTVFAVVAQMLQFIDIALANGAWPIGALPHNYVLGDWLGRIESRTLAHRRDDCWLCGPSAATRDPRAFDE